MTANLGAELASRGDRVLLIDLDPRASLSFSFFTIDHWDGELEPNKTVKRWFETAGKPDQVKLSTLVVTPETVRASIMGNSGALDLIASHLGLVNTDIDLASGLSGGNSKTSRSGRCFNQPRPRGHVRPDDPADPRRGRRLPRDRRMGQ